MRRVEEDEGNDGVGGLHGRLTVTADAGKQSVIKDARDGPPSTSPPRRIGPIRWAEVDPGKGGRGLRVCIVRKSGIHLGLQENDVSVADVSVHVETRRFFIRTPSINFCEEKTRHRRPFTTHPAWPLVKHGARIRILFPHPQNIFFTPSMFIYLFHTK